MLVLNLPFKALMFLTLMRPSLVLFLVLWLKLVKDFLKVRCRLALRSEERFSRNAETDLVCRLLLEKKKICVAGTGAHLRRVWCAVAACGPMSGSTHPFQAVFMLG